MQIREGSLLLCYIRLSETSFHNGRRRTAYRAQGQLIVQGDALSEDRLRPTDLQRKGSMAANRHRLSTHPQSDRLTDHVFYPHESLFQAKSIPDRLESLSAARRHADTKSHL